jgi:hypothetical protein
VEANASCNCGVSYVAKSVRAAEAIRANPNKSDRAIAAELGVSDRTVNRARDSRATYDAPDERTGRDGKSYSIQQRIRREPGRVPHRGRPEEFPSLCVNYDTSRCRESTYFASVLSLTGARRQWRVPFEKRRPSQVAVGNARSRQALMKIVLVVAGPLFIALGLFWFGQAAGLVSGPHNALSTSPP